MFKTFFEKGIELYIMHMLQSSRLYRQSYSLEGPEEFVMRGKFGDLVGAGNRSGGGNVVLWAFTMVSGPLA